MCGRRPRCKENLACGLRSGAGHVSGLLMRREPLALMCSADRVLISFSGCDAHRPQSGYPDPGSTVSHHAIITLAIEMRRYGELYRFIAKPT
jgi:hypothetical protein